jgi:hypothetical protein
MLRRAGVVVTDLPSRTQSHWFIEQLMGRRPSKVHAFTRAAPTADRQLIGAKLLVLWPMLYLKGFIRSGPGCRAATLA